MKRIGTPWGEFEGLMKPVLTLSSTNVQRAPNSDGESEYMHPGGGSASSSKLILRSYGQCVGSFCFSLAEHISELMILFWNISEIRSVRFGCGICEDSFL